MQKTKTKTVNRTCRVCKKEFSTSSRYRYNCDEHKGGPYRFDRKGFAQRLEAKL